MLPEPRDWDGPQEVWKHSGITFSRSQSHRKCTAMAEREVVPQLFPSSYPPVSHRCLQLYKSNWNSQYKSLSSAGYKSQALAVQMKAGESQGMFQRQMCPRPAQLHLFFTCSLPSCPFSQAYDSGLHSAASTSINKHQTVAFLLQTCKRISKICQCL